MFLVLLVACDLFGGKTEDEGPTCSDTKSTLGADEASPLGFTANELLPTVEGDFAEILLYADGSSSPLSLSFTSDPGAIQFVDSEAVYPEGNHTDIGIICEDRLEIGGIFAFSTEDGLFNDSFEAVLSAMAVSEASLSVDLIAQPSAGSFDPESYPTTDYDELSMSIDAMWSSEGSIGTVGGSTLKDEGCDGDVCSASSEQLEVGSWE